MYKSRHPITRCNNFAVKLVMRSNTHACDNDAGSDEEEF